jgi:ketosteroid isomerase-like protein
MTRSEEIKAIVARLYAARKSGDVDASLRFFADNATFAMNGSKQASGIAMEARGKDEIRAALTNLLNVYDMHEQTILSFLVDDEKAAVHHRSKLKFKTDRRSLRYRNAGLMEVRRGQDHFGDRVRGHRARAASPVTSQVEP